MIFERRYACVMGTQFIARVVGIAAFAFPVIAEAGFDFWAYANLDTRVAELYVRNRGIGGMYGPGVQTGTKLLAMKIDYLGDPVVFAARDDGNGSFHVDLENRFTDPLHKSWIRLGTQPFYVYANPGFDQASQWESVSQFTVEGMAQVPPTITAEAGYRFARLVIPSGFSTRLSGRVGSEIGPGIDFDNSPFFGFSDGIYFDQRSYDSTLSPDVPAGTQLIAGRIDGYGASEPSVISSDNLPSFLSLHYEFVNGRTSFEVTASRLLTAADAGIYVSQLDVRNPIAGGGSVNFTVQVLPEPAILMLSVSAFAVCARRRAPLM